MRIKIDLHNHLGRGGKNPGFDKTIDLAHSKLGYGGVFGICNDGPTDKRYEKFVNQKGGKYKRIFIDIDKSCVYVPEKEISVVKVEEIEPKAGHFLAVGMPSGKRIWKNKNPPSLEDALTAANDFETIKIAVHPFSKDGIGYYLKRNKSLLEEFNGWEIYNSSAELFIPGILPKNANQKSRDFYFSDIKDVYEIGACAFTDGHSCEVIGKSYTIIEDNKNLFFKMLKLGIKNNKDTRNLHMESAKNDALKHCFHMAKQILFKISA